MPGTPAPALSAAPRHRCGPGQQQGTLSQVSDPSTDPLQDSPLGWTSLQSPRDLAPSLFAASLSSSTRRRSSGPDHLVSTGATMPTPDGRANHSVAVSHSVRPTSAPSLLARFGGAGRRYQDTAPDRPDDSPHHPGGTATGRHPIERPDRVPSAAPHHWPIPTSIRAEPPRCRAYSGPLSRSHPSHVGSLRRLSDHRGMRVDRTHLLDEEILFVVSDVFVHHFVQVACRTSRR